MVSPGKRVKRIALRTAGVWANRNLRGAIQGWDVPLLEGCATASSANGALATATRLGADLWAGGVSSTSTRDRVIATPSNFPMAELTVPMRCAVVTESIDVGGMDEVAATLALALAERGVIVAVLHAPRNRREGPGKLGEALLAAGIPVATTTSEQGRGWLKAWRPDVLSVHGAPDWVITAAEQLGVPLVETLHGPFELLGGRLDPVRERAASVVLHVAVSELVREQYLKAVPDLDASRIITVPNGVRSDIGRLPDRRLVRDALGLNDEFLVVSLARHCIQKNTYGVVTAFTAAAAHRPDSHLVLTGRTDDARYARRVAAAIGDSAASSRIHLRTHLHSPLPLLAAADAFVLDSFFEGWALASMEAIAAGVPTILADVGGAREQLTGTPEPTYGRSERGYLVPNPLGDPLRPTWDAMTQARWTPQSNQSELVGALGDVMDSREEWRGARAERHDAARGAFDLGATVDRHLALLRTAARGEVQ